MCCHSWQDSTNIDYLYDYTKRAAITGPHHGYNNNNNENAKKILLITFCCEKEKCVLSNGKPIVSEKYLD